VPATAVTATTAISDKHGSSDKRQPNRKCSSMSNHRAGCYGRDRERTVRFCRLRRTLSKTIRACQTLRRDRIKPTAHAIRTKQQNGQRFPTPNTLQARPGKATESTYIHPNAGVANHPPTIPPRFVPHLPLFLDSIGYALASGSVPPVCHICWPQAGDEW
ncbi:MAG: hypothetical protein RLZZ458_895, partial [Planctomycetota bacterium]